MYRGAKYSILMYFNEMLEEDIEYIIESLRDGITIHLLMEISKKKLC